MADISKITLPNGTVYNLKDSSAVHGVKGNSETNYRTGNVNITAANIGLGNVGNFKAVSTVASQGLSSTEQSNARANIGAGTSSFSGSYNDLSNKPTIPSKTSQLTNDSGFITTDTNTHRPIQVNGTEVLGNNTTALNLKAGSNVSLSNSSGTVTIAATDTNTWRPVSDSVSSTSSSDAASSKAVKTAYDLANGKANASHTHKYAGSASAGGPANLLAGTYSGNGGQLTPSAVSGGQVKAAMMNNPKGLSGFPTYCDTILMDTYTGNDVPWTTGLGIAKQDASPRMFIFNGAKGNTTTWKNITEVITAGNFSSQSLTKSQVTTALGYTPPTTDTNTHRPIQVNGTEVLGNNTTALNLKAGSNVSITNSSGTVTIAATDTNTWRSISDAVNSTSSDVSASSKAVKTAYDLAASKTSNTGTVTSVATGVGLTGGTITGSGTLKAKLKSETARTIDALSVDTSTSKLYPVVADKSGNLAVGVPWTDNNTKNTAGSTDTSSKIFLIGATSQAANPQTYSQDTAYVGTDGCLYSGGSKVRTESTKYHLWYKNVPVSKLTGTIIDLRDSDITSDYVLEGNTITWDDPSKITTDIKWSTGTAGRFIVTGTCIATTTATFALVKADKKKGN